MSKSSVSAKHAPILILGHSRVDKLVIDSPMSGTGHLDLKDGIGAHFYSHAGGSEAGFVMSWADFERAYLLVKAAREAMAASPLPSESDPR